NVSTIGKLPVTARAASVPAARAGETTRATGTSAVPMARRAWRSQNMGAPSESSSGGEPLPARLVGPTEPGRVRECEARRRFATRRIENGEERWRAGLATVHG